MIFDVTKNYFEVNPDHKFIFTEFYNTEARTSELFWILAFLYHPKSPYKDIPFSQRKEYIKQQKLEWEDSELTEELVVAYNKNILTKNQQLLRVWERKIEERNELLDKLSYANASDVDILEKLLGNSKKLWDQFLSVQRLVDEDVQESTRGGEEESFLDKGDYF